MKTNFKYGLLLLVALFSMTAGTVSAKPKEKKDRVWTEHPTKYGVRSTFNMNVANGAWFNASALYYYGDVDRLGLAFNGGFQPQNLSLGGLFSVGFMTPLAHAQHFNWRFSLYGGTLNGNNRESRPDGTRQFKSYFGEVFAGIEYYPFNNLGFYLFAGLSANVSYIKYDFIKAAGSTVSVLPMVPIGLGWAIPLGKKGVYFQFEATIHQGLLDSPGVNLDAYPMAPSQNMAGVSFGRGGMNHWADGYFQIGFSISYRWKNCEKCRMYRWN